MPPDVKRTALFIVALVVVALGWEAYALLSPDAATITATVAGLNALTGGMVGFLLGFLCGHFFWPRKRRSAAN